MNASGRYFPRVDSMDCFVRTPKNKESSDHVEAPFMLLSTIDVELNSTEYLL